MPPKSESSTPKVSGRRSTTQPKSTRQQFSACGACRIRRVRCNLKDLPDAKSCFNCQEHGFNCVDEYRESKPVKLLRRGRRIQQVEAVYGPGNSAPEQEQSEGPSASGSTSTAVPKSPSLSVIPRLDPQFFNSRFYPRFHIQRPIIEPEEFKARYIAFFNGNAEALGIPGQMIAMLLVVWAASYGVDEHGREEPHDGALGVRRRKQRTNDMVKELLRLIDIHGLSRKPSWDGVRVLLLIMPLTEEVAEPLERLTMYETAINQVYTLCSLASPRSVNSGQGESVDALVRARIYWYAFVHEGITTGLRGGRLHLADDDLHAFQLIQEGGLPVARSEVTMTYSRRWALAPLRLAAACRKVHGALTGPKARSEPDVDEYKLNQAWESIETCWEEFESLRTLGLLGILTVEEADRFVDGWKIFIFECHNVIREFLKQRLVSASGGGDTGHLADAETLQRTLNTLNHLHAIAESKCQDVAQHVVSLVRRHLGTSFFEYDASLVRDGCFFAGYILSGESDTNEYGTTCLQALSEMRWAFSKSEERVQTLKLIWESRGTARSSQESTSPPPFDPPPRGGGERSMPIMASRHPPDSNSRAWSLPNTAPDKSSPVEPLSSHPPPDSEHSTSYRGCSMSSTSSVPSTGSPFTPSLQPVAPTSYPLDFEPKTGHVAHTNMYGGDVGPRLSLTPTDTRANGPQSSSECYQYDAQRMYRHDLPHPQAQYQEAMSSPHGFVGPDGILYTSPASGPHPPQGDSHPYPNHGPQYYYS